MTDHDVCELEHISAAFTGSILKNFVSRGYELSEVIKILKQTLDKQLEDVV